MEKFLLLLTIIGNNVAQPDLEDALGICGFGYPALNVRKMKYSWLRGSLRKNALINFCVT
ncbi:hypothetical protein B4U80_10331 [Leptotrombidium deliense]|uniref:Uncharacterized protein n=1 Tax=Leptotrombidium deliense TaxID=299467 RepID=A0A443S1Q9_9ACAR|nr:hypothetical protein B4U80_10331 [Leptotrombidium deliense]